MQFHTLHREKKAYWRTSNNSTNSTNFFNQRAPVAQIYPRQRPRRKPPNCEAKPTPTRLDALPLASDRLFCTRVRRASCHTVTARALAPDRRPSPRPARSTGRPGPRSRGKLNGGSSGGFNKAAYPGGGRHFGVGVQQSSLAVHSAAGGVSSVSPTLAITTLSRQTGSALLSIAGPC